VYIQEANLRTGTRTARIQGSIDVCSGEWVRGMRDASLYYHRWISVLIVKSLSN